MRERNVALARLSTHSLYTFFRDVHSLRQRSQSASILAVSLADMGGAADSPRKALSELRVSSF
jgi:hypothetical protein